MEFGVTLSLESVTAWEDERENIFWSCGRGTDWRLLRCLGSVELDVRTVEFQPAPSSSAT